MAISQPNPFDHAAIIRVTRSDSAAVIADLVAALERIAGLTPIAANATTAYELHYSVKAIADAALSKARGE